jgi:hypothetical protein
MLCKRPTDSIETTVKKMGGSEFFIEEKLDGERIQLHKRGNEYFYCSRSVNFFLLPQMSDNDGKLVRERITPTCTASTSVKEV